ncbi:MAG: hypothetical protein AB7E72_01470 [Lysobacterales bacterium]
MNLVSLTTGEVKRLVTIFALLSIVLAAIVAFVILSLRGEDLNDHLFATGFQAVSGGVTIATVCFAILAKQTWQWKFLAKVLDRPIVHGVWHGKIWTNHGVQVGSSPRPIEIVLVIQQTYLALSIVSFTPAQEGESVIEAMLRNAKTDATRLCYVYELRRRYQSENRLTLGSGELKLVESRERLRGHYFTNSPTEGEIDLRLITRDCQGIDSFDSAMKLIRRHQRATIAALSSTSK